MDTTYTIESRLGRRPHSASARMSSAGVVAVSMAGLKQEADNGGSHEAKKPATDGLRSVRHRPPSARPGSASSRPGSARRRLSAEESVKSLQIFDALIADNDPPPLPGWSEHVDDEGKTFWYNAAEGRVTYGEPTPRFTYMVGRQRLRRHNQPMSLERRPRSAAARLQYGSPSPPRRRPSSASPVLTAGGWSSQAVARQSTGEMLAAAEAEATAALQEYEDLVGEDVEGQSDDGSTSSTQEGCLQAVTEPLVEKGQGWQTPVDPPLREEWSVLQGGGAGSERATDATQIMRDRTMCQSAVARAIFDERWPGEDESARTPARSKSPPAAVTDRAVSQDRYEYQTSPDGRSVFLVKQDPESPEQKSPNPEVDSEEVLSIEVASWLSSVGLGAYCTALAKIGTTFGDFEGLTAGDLFVAGVQDPDAIAQILIRMRCRVPPIRVIPRPRTASPESRARARPGSAQAAAPPSFAEEVAIRRSASAEDAPDPSIVEALVHQGISLDAAKRAASATSNAGIEAAMKWTLSEKRPDAVAVPAAGTLEIRVEQVSGFACPRLSSKMPKVRRPSLLLRKSVVSNCRLPLAHSGYDRRKSFHWR